MFQQLPILKCNSLNINLESNTDESRPVRQNRLKALKILFSGLFHSIAKNKHHGIKRAIRKGHIRL